ncbi:ATP-binding protein [Roseobacter sp.]|uniref:ATP-binding protein n=1 Tax=Roseobacter sp. TaxID=1907202 RepID=UPI00385D6405
MVLIVVLVTLQFGGTRFVTQRQAISTVEINLSGRQRMLSQRIGWMMHRVASARETSSSGTLADLRAVLAHCVNLMEKSHRALQARDRAKMQTVLEAGHPCFEIKSGASTILPKERIALKESSILATFTQSAWMVAEGEANADAALQFASGFEAPLEELLFQLNQATYDAQEASTAQIQKLLWFNWFLILALVLGEVVLIFRPMVKAVEGYIQRLQDTNMRLSQSEARLQGFAAIGAHQFWETDENHRFTYVASANPDTRLLGSSDQIGKTLWDIEGVTQNNGIDWNSYKSALNTPRAVKGFEYSIQTKQARKQWWRVYGQPVFSTNGTFTGFRGTSLEITKQREAEDKLRLSERMTTVGQLTAGIAHDFNNILAVIQGNAELLSIEQDGPARSKNAREIVAAVGRGASLTSRLLSFGRVQRLTPRQIDTTIFLNDLEPLLNRTLGEDFDVVVLPPVRPVNVLADLHQLEDACLNLAINARDAADTGGRLWIEVTAVKTPDRLPNLMGRNLNNELLKFSFRDNGCGIQEDIQERIFEPFFTTKPVGEGSGLGLSMVYGFAHQSGGFVEVDSVPGEGTTFDLYLPRAPDSAVVSSAKDPQKSLQTTKRMLALLVEDNDALRSVARKQLEYLGFSVDEAGEGGTAVEKLKHKGPFDLLLLDIVLPGGIDGVAVAKFAAQANPKAKILFCTGFAGHYSDSSKYSELPGPVLSKPFGIDQLRKQIERLLSKNKNGNGADVIAH